MTTQSKVDEYFERIKELKGRIFSAPNSSFTPKQKQMYEEVQRAYQNQPNTYLSKAQLQSLVTSDLNERDLLISDFVYNTVNKEDKAIKFMVKQGQKYLFVGTNYKPQNPIDVTWEVRISGITKYVVGTYSESGYSWNFTRLQEYLKSL